MVVVCRQWFLTSSCGNIIFLVYPRCVVAVGIIRTLLLLTPVHYFIELYFLQEPLLSYFYKNHEQNPINYLCERLAEE